MDCKSQRRVTCGRFMSADGKVEGREMRKRMARQREGERNEVAKIAAGYNMELREQVQKESRYHRRTKGIWRVGVAVESEQGKMGKCDGGRDKGAMERKGKKNKRTKEQWRENRIQRCGHKRETQDLANCQQNLDWGGGQRKREKESRTRWKSHVLDLIELL